MMDIRLFLSSLHSGSKNSAGYWPSMNLCWISEYIDEGNRPCTKFWRLSKFSRNGSHSRNQEEQIGRA